MERNFNIGDEVYWNDPDNGICSGLYTITDKLTEDGENSVWIISQGYGNSTEVFQHELS